MHRPQICLNCSLYVLHREADEVGMFDLAGGRTFKLSSEPNSGGIACGGAGAFAGTIPLLQKDGIAQAGACGCHVPLRS